MNRRLFIFPIYLLLFSNVIGQNNRLGLIRKADLNLLLIKEKLIADSIINIYGDSSISKINKKVNDSTFIKSWIQQNPNSYDNQISLIYKIPYIIKPLGWTSDYEHIFTEEQTITLDSILDNYEKQTTNEIAIVTFDSSFIKNEDFDSLVLSIHNLWAVGKRNKNNGILIGISIAKRKIRISNGYGIEAKLSDNQTMEIINDIILPAFKKGNYFEGLQNAIVDIMEKIK